MFLSLLRLFASFAYLLTGKLLHFISCKKSLTKL